MADARKSKYQKAVERAKARGFASPYAERKARSIARGFTSPRAERTARERARGIKRDYKLEQERRDIRANARGFRNAHDQSLFNKLPPGVDREKWLRDRVLKEFGITKRQLDQIRRENRHWTNEQGQLHYSEINTYKTEIDSDIHNWSRMRIGYILSFNAAVVNPETNYESLIDKNGRRKLTPEGKPLMNKSQYDYLVKYTNLMQVDRYEARYGLNQVAE